MRLRWASQGHLALLLYRRYVTIISDIDGEGSHAIGGQMMRRNCYDEDDDASSPATNSEHVKAGMYFQTLCDLTVCFNLKVMNTCFWFNFMYLIDFKINLV